MELSAPLQSIGDVFTAFRDGSSIVAGRFAAQTQLILTACIAIKFVKAWLESLSGLSSGLLEEAVGLIITGALCSIAIEHHADIANTAWALMGGVMEVMNVNGDVPADGTGIGVLTHLWNSCLGVIKETWALFMATNVSPATCEGGALENITCKLSAATELFANNLFALSFYIIFLILVLVYFGVMMLQVFTGIFAIGIGLMFLPVTIAFWPLIDSWAKKAIGKIAGGIAHMGMVAFLVSLVSSVVKNLTGQFVSGKYQLFDGGPAGSLDILLGKGVLLLVLCAFMVVMALASAKAFQFASEIFSSIGFTGANFSSKGGSSSGGGKGGADAGAAAAPAGTAGTAAAAGATVAAGVATGGAGAVAGTGASTAGGTAAAGSAGGAGTVGGVAGAVGSGSGGGSTPMNTSSVWRSSPGGSGAGSGAGVGGADGGSEVAGGGDAGSGGSAAGSDATGDDAGGAGVAQDPGGASAEEGSSSLKSMGIKAMKAAGNAASSVAVAPVKATLANAASIAKTYAGMAGVRVHHSTAPSKRTDSNSPANND